MTNPDAPKWQKPPLYAFDLDGTITLCEILPCLAAHVGLTDEITRLTQQTLSGERDFASSFVERVALLQHIPLATVHAAIAAMPLDPDIVAFIHEHQERVVVVTGNLDCWIAPLMQRLGCRFFSSQGLVTERGITITNVLEKGSVMRTLAQEGRPLVAIGESANDIPMFREAHVGIAYGGVHAPMPELARMAHHVVASGKELCELLLSLETIKGYRKL